MLWHTCAVDYNIHGEAVERIYFTNFLLTYAKRLPTYISSDSIDFCSALCELSSWGVK